LRCELLTVDVTDPESVRSMVNDAIDLWGRVDILVNNAGRGLHAPIPKTSLEEWQSVLDTNLTGVFLCTKEAVKRMGRLRIKGHIITISSIAGLYGAPQYSAYCASKHGVTGFMRSAKLELRKHGIRTSNIHPARVDTEFFDVYTKRPGRSQMLSPDDIADVVIARAKRNILLIVWVRLVNVIKRIYYPVRYSISK
ncbi:SDR family oxidoreductase, partial [Candidatus Woesearchaeota archaeon]|nr:SDR family oxidoreductase [Candidatus Woesearchaeota archaeon]